MLHCWQLKFLVTLMADGPSIRRDHRTRWGGDEEESLRACVAELGEEQWQQIALRLATGHSAISLKRRWARLKRSDAKQAALEAPVALPANPAGADGAEGADGADSADGTDGADCADGIDCGAHGAPLDAPPKPRRGRIPKTQAQRRSDDAQKKRKKPHARNRTHRPWRPLRESAEEALAFEARGLLPRHASEKLMHAQNALSLLLAAIFERELPRASRILSTLGREFCQLTAAVAQLGIELHRQVRCGSPRL